YGLAAARRRQIRIYGALAAAAGVVLLLLAGILLTLLSGEDAGAEAVLPTFRPTNTATATTTATPGVTSTPSPESADPLPTFEPPSNLIAGNIYGGTPTAVYPVIPSGAGRDFELAVAQYSIGDYQPAFAVFEQRQNEAESSNIDCNAQAYYFHAVGLAEQGGRKNLQDAEALLQRAVTRPICTNNNQSRALINTAACVVDYLQGIETGDTSQYVEATTLCESAIEDIRPERPIVLSVTTLARLYTLNGDYDAAATILDDALADWPNDVNLMLVRARVELQRGRLDDAFNYISRALYVEPTSETALRLRVEAFLQTASQESNPQRQIQLYGTGVTWTQEYLLYYPGEPDGYLLLAQARLGEGNLDLAEEALNRIIEVRRTLPDNKQTIVLAAYRLRAQVYLQTARHEQALEDIELLLGQDTGETDLALLEQRMNLVYTLGN
ncbi:MAG: tetratricopeptide repeat protein, partial [Anaerolineae bacterium]|nr:tetratricopeptide repeat protein [Anaerolineae bacterium]